MLGWMASSWSSFFVAQVGASAALTGLVFVAISINLRSIIDFPALVERAAEAVVLLVQPVIVGLVVLVPDRSLRATGITCLVVSGIGFVLVNRVVLRAPTTARDRPGREIAVRIALAEVAELPSIVGSIALIAGAPGGFDWIALGAAIAIVTGILDAWVLLVEILR